MAKRKQVGNRDPQALAARRKLGANYKASIQDAPADYEDAHRINRLYGVLDIKGYAPKCATCGAPITPSSMEEWKHLTYKAHPFGLTHDVNVNTDTVPEGLNTNLGQQFK